MYTFNIILITLIVYSIIATTIYVISGEREEVTMAFGLGIFGLSLWLVMNGIRSIRKKFLYHIGKRSIFKHKKSGELYKCKVKDTKNIEWLYDYKLVKRYATKSEWSDVPDFSTELIELSKCNCDNCKYDKECIHDDRDYPYYSKIRCKHNEYGTVMEFDQFKKK